MNISSIVVRTTPEHMDAVKAGLEAGGLCEIHFADEFGRIVVTVEGDEKDDETMKLKEIQALPHVASADFSYIFTDDEQAPGAGNRELGRA